MAKFRQSTRDRWLYDYLWLWEKPSKKTTDSLSATAAKVKKSTSKKRRKGT